jgi:hypothetical protein
MHHLRPGEALRYARWSVVGRVVRREVPIELVELAVDPRLLDLANDVLVALLVALGSPPFTAAI